MKTTGKHYKITNKEVQLAVSETGQGQKLLFFNGGVATQVSWKRIIGELGAVSARDLRFSQPWENHDLAQYIP
ncbi:hypothetical protein KSC_028790 [Ktedonobacter sp. SOSP1-52]|nr:hypothetical protein KSC_028790 [Ktedonobacter sp. SOSP1-52]